MAIGSGLALLDLSILGINCSVCSGGGNALLLRVLARCDSCDGGGPGGGGGYPDELAVTSSGLLFFLC